MRKWISAGALAMFLLAAFGSSNAFAQLKAGDKAPDIKLSDVINGDKKDFDTFKGKVVFLEFWATW